MGGAEVAACWLLRRGGGAMRFNQEGAQMKTQTILWPFCRLTSDPAFPLITLLGAARKLHFPKASDADKTLHRSVLPAPLFGPKGLPTLDSNISGEKQAGEKSVEYETAQRCGKVSVCRARSSHLSPCVRLPGQTRSARWCTCCCALMTPQPTRRWPALSCRMIEKRVRGVIDVDGRALLRPLSSLTAHL